MIYADIILSNVDDELRANRAEIKMSDVRKVEVKALVYTGAYMLAINEMINKQLQIPLTGTTIGETADGRKIELKVVGPIRIYFKTRQFITEAAVLPDDSEVLLGAIPLEAMDVVIDPLKEELRLPPDRPYIPLVKMNNKHRCRIYPW